MLHIAFAVAAALALPKYWSVHIDTPRAEVRSEFEKTDVEFYGIQRTIYSEHHIDWPPVVHFSADGVYYGLRPRAALADIEKPSTVPDDVRKLIAEKTAAVSERTHPLLRTHHNEIWETDPDTTLVTSSAAPRYMRLRSEETIPGKEKDYDAVMKRVRAACEKANVGILAFFSDYDDGSSRYLFTSDKPIDLHALFGRELLADWQKCVITSHEADAKALPEVSGTDPAHWLP
ncbi:MAG TPA: hypothetical protein VH087_04645 [Thermoanaerobaculia bacterium]|jgi:hypothetical protein|nr:hypothetical protein [Thermoanaerobaculia bacterium]